MLSPTKSRLIHIASGDVFVHQLTLGAVLSLIADNPDITEKLFTTQVDIMEVVKELPAYADVIIEQVCTLDDVSRAALAPLDKARIVFAALEQTIAAVGEAADAMGKFLNAVLQMMGVPPETLPEDPSLSVDP
jgi:hypothetical protein